MDLLDKIQRTDFLGSEWLLWLWFASEVCESELPVGARTVGLWLDAQLVLTSAADESEKTTLRGAAPSGTPEAKEALRQGKLPVKAHVTVALDERSFAFNLDATPLSIASVKLPELVNEEIDERFYERMMLLDELEQVLWQLLEAFVTLRLSRAWNATFLPLMQAWLRQDKRFDPDAARKRVQRVTRAAAGRT